MTTLRPYQSRIFESIPQELAKHGSTLVQAPTGSGKSIIMQATVNRIQKAGKTALVISHRKKIHTQLKSHCKGVSIDSSIDHLHIVGGHCYVAMIQTLVNRPQILAQFQSLGRNLVLITDECHIGTGRRIKDKLPDCFRIGFTATPSYNQAPFLRNYYGSLIHGPQPMELIKDGFLAHYRHEMMSGADLSHLEKKGGEYTEKSQEIVFGTAKLYAGIETELGKGNFNKCIVFCASIKAAEALNDELTGKGFKSVCYHSQRKNGQAELDKFTGTAANIVVSVGALSEGFDYPPIDLVVLYRKTTSLPLYLQMCGRGGRPLPTKNGFKVLDFGENAKMFGPWSAARDWNALWQPPPNKLTNANSGLTPSKECPQCFTQLATTSKSCWNCGYIYPVKEVELAEGQLRLVTDTLTAMTGRKVSTLSPEELATYANHADRKSFAIRVAKSREQDSTGFLKAFASAMGYHPAWVKRQVLPGEKIPFADLLVKF